MTASREYKYEWEVLYLKCSQCWEWLTIDEYHKDKSKKFWVRNECKNCNHKRASEYYRLNKDKIIRKVNKWTDENKDSVDGYKKKYRDTHKDEVSKCLKSNRENHTSELWFNRDTFHQRAIKFIRKNNLRPTECPICWSNKNIVSHHPSYDSYDKWSSVVFCCQSCHKLIHKWEIECPSPVDLLTLIN